MYGLEAMCRRRTAQGDHTAAIDAGLRTVQIEPLHETAQRVLIATHLGDGNVAEAVRQVRSFRASCIGSSASSPELSCAI
jgi:Bacterial transcriptional activator domain